MKVSKEELVAVLAQFNSWWRGDAIVDPPGWWRTAFRELCAWLAVPPTPRAARRRGARQIGKTMLPLRAADMLLRDGLPPPTCSTPPSTPRSSRSPASMPCSKRGAKHEPRAEGPEFLLFDEAQFIRSSDGDVGTWVKHRVDSQMRRRIALTGPAMPLPEIGHRWWQIPARCTELIPANETLHACAWSMSGRCPTRPHLADFCKSLTSRYRP